MNRKLINWIGLTGLAALISYAAAAYFCRGAFPGYNWMESAVSDLSAETAPSRQLWDRLSAVYSAGSVVCATCVAIYVSDKKISTKLFRVGIYLFTLMNWISKIGYSMFSLDDAGKDISSFQEVMHMIVTVFVVGFSIVSLLLLIIAGFRNKEVRGVGIWAAIFFAMMLMGPIGMQALPPQYFGIAERCSIYATIGFNAILGIYLFNGFDTKGKEIAANV
ncbi:DUF998 domain-containing protein [Butyrivibrio sp. CB08]|uniref:DUF998 domain-containing protein n=1 Tax=Butyrivibrio sp. CB08 TaxID=2364879 RepID=UPI000EA85FE1|nr:DUF998 domain-containing protein [Butyrivibrio sp. CB08]RKM59402.1 DUF998 domain-containing protein [Butyrivibrio sp. CB08]